MGQCGGRVRSNGDGTTHTITGLTDGVEYTVRIIAVNGVGEGDPSGEATGNADRNHAAGAFLRLREWRDPDHDLQRNPGRGLDSRC